MQLCSIREQVLANRQHARNVDEQGGGLRACDRSTSKRCVACLGMARSRPAAMNLSGEKV